MNAVMKFVPVMIAALMGNIAYAADGTINVRGRLVNATCTIAVNGVVSPAATVTLPTVSTSVLDAAGKVAGRTTFNIELTNCDLDKIYSSHANAFFEAGADVDPISGQLINRGDATNVRLQLLNIRRSGTAVPIKVGDPSQHLTNNSVEFFYPRPLSITPRIAPEIPGPYVLQHAVEYIATAPTTEGSVLSTVTYSINYF